MIRHPPINRLPVDRQILLFSIPIERSTKARDNDKQITAGEQTFNHEAFDLPHPNLVAIDLVRPVVGYDDLVGADCFPFVVSHYSA